MNAFEQLFAQAEAAQTADPGDYVVDGIRHCGRCRQPKQYWVSAFDRKYLMPIMCRCQEERQERERIQREIWRRETRREGIVDHTFHNWTFEISDEPLDFAHRYVDGFEKYRRDNTGLMLLGPRGTGKTFAAACIANALVDRGYTVHMANALALVDKMRNFYSEERQEFLQSLDWNDLLIIDDFGVEKNTEFIIEQLYNIVERRYRSRKPLIITSNLMLKDLATDIPELDRVYDRLREMCFPVILDGESRRKKIGNQRYKDLKQELLG